MFIGSCLHEQVAHPLNSFCAYIGLLKTLLSTAGINEACWGLLNVASSVALIKVPDYICQNNWSQLPDNPGAYFANHTGVWCKQTIVLFRVQSDDRLLIRYSRWLGCCDSWSQRRPIIRRDAVAAAAIYQRFSCTLSLYKCQRRATPLRCTISLQHSRRQETRRRTRWKQN